MRLVRLGLEHQSFRFDAQGVRQARPRGAHVPLSDKRSVLSEVLARQGHIPILQIGMAIDRMPLEPVLVALGAAKTPGDLLNRWGRLERFVHSRHRIVEENTRSHKLRLRHVSLVAGQPPRVEEDLLIFGVMVGLLRWTGVGGLRARFRGDVDWSFDGHWINTPMARDTSDWEIAWDTVQARPPLEKTGKDPVEQLWTLMMSDLTRR